MIPKIPFFQYLSETVTSVMGFTFRENMALSLKLPIRFPIFAPTLDANQVHHSTEVRFSRWNNANAEKFNERRRTQQEIEDDIRRTRRFDSATKIADTADASSAAAVSASVQTFKSAGTPSAPSRPSIPGRKSKYSKPPSPPEPMVDKSNVANPKPRFQLAPENVRIGDDGVSYVVDGAPFEFRYSYTETPAAKPIRMREPPFVPFGPANTSRPWTGRKPQLPSQKKPKEFNSFIMPPADKKGVKPVQSPGPFLLGSGPRYVKSSKELLGEPLTPEEITELVNGTMKSTRQLNIGRHGLTHNMLENIHALWKRRRVCKIKCKGVCTVDMDNVCQQLEERTGGKIIYRKGGTVYLFRGRNYNYKTRPRFPLMLWKPAPPVYPRLIQHVPEGLTLKKATEMRQKGRNLIPICKLAKNGVYHDLVANVTEAFEECELMRINCQGLHESDYRRIGAKLRDLVPCILLSFEDDHILMWRGQNWRSSLPSLGDNCKEANNIDVEGENLIALTSDAQELSAPSSLKNSSEHLSSESHDTSISSSSSVASSFQVEVPYPTEDSDISVSMVSDAIFTDVASLTLRTCEVETTDDFMGPSGEPPPSTSASPSVTMLGTSSDSINGSVDPQTDKLLHCSGATDCTGGVLLLLEQAVEESIALVLDDESSLDADIVYQTTVAFAKSAPLGPVFRVPRKVMAQKSDMQEDLTLEKKKITTVMTKEEIEKTPKSSKIQRKKDFDEQCLNVVPQGSIVVDKLARLLT